MFSLLNKNLGAGTRTHLVSINAFHFLLHGGVGLQNRSENLHGGVQRAVIQRHGNHTESHRRAADVQEGSGRFSGVESANTCHGENSC